MSEKSKSSRENNSIEVVVEISKGSRNKYEYDHETHRIRLDRVLYSSVVYPTDYGFIEETLAKDGDPIDVLIVTHEPTFPGCIVPARPIGVLQMSDQAGQDDKILAVPIGDPRFEEVSDLNDVAHHFLLEIENFFATYKHLEGKEVKISGWQDQSAAWQNITECQERYKHQEGKVAT